MQKIFTDRRVFYLQLSCVSPITYHISNLVACWAALRPFFIQCNTWQLSKTNHSPCWALFNLLAITTFWKHPRIDPWLERTETFIYTAGCARSLCAPCAILIHTWTTATHNCCSLDHTVIKLFDTSYWLLILIICKHCSILIHCLTIYSRISFLRVSGS